MVENPRWYSYTSSTETMRSWVRVIDTVDEIPTAFQQAIPHHLAQFSYGLLIPINSFFSRRERAIRILLLYRDHFLVSAQYRSGEIKTQIVRYEDLLGFERGRVLLYSWIRFFTLSGEITLKFNTTHDRFFRPALEIIRQAMRQTTEHRGEILPEMGNQIELAKLDHLSAVNYKYMNYARSCLRPEDEIASMIYQPQRTNYRIHILNQPLFKFFTTDHLTLITRDEIIHIRENKPIKRDKNKDYGGVFTFIPRGKNPNINLSDPEDHGIVKLNIQLDDIQLLDCELSADHPDLELLRQI